MTVRRYSVAAKRAGIITVSALFLSFCLHALHEMLTRTAPRQQHTLALRPIGTCPQRGSLTLNGERLETVQRRDMGTVTAPVDLCNLLPRHYLPNSFFSPYNAMRRASQVFSVTFLPRVGNSSWAFAFSLFFHSVLP